MSLLKEIQHITERTYQQVSGINLEDFIIGRQRFWTLSELSSMETRELPDIARIFFRVIGNRLYMAIYYSDPMIAALERHDPRRGLNEKNIYPFLVFVEELNHAVHAALKFLSGERNIKNEHFIRDLELMAKVDCYQTSKFFVAYFNASKRLECWDRLWLRYHLFERGDTGYQSANLYYRYAEVNVLGEKYTRFLDALSSSHRLDEMRRFRKMNYDQKKRYIQILP